jgi:ABC-type branched-subunit amino acid transport system substrate-binding protein
MKPSRTLLLVAMTSVLAGCGGTAATTTSSTSQAAFSSRFPPCAPYGQGIYNYLHTGVDGSQDHTLDVNFADKRAAILKQPDGAQDGLMRAEAQKAVNTCEQSVAPNLAVPGGPGVTYDTITLGIITDLSGIFANFGRTVSRGSELFWQDQNRRGGVCGRRVNLLIKDHGYNVQNAVGLYVAMQPKVLAFQELLGSPETAAVLGNIATDQVLTEPVAWSSKLLSNPYIVLSGTTYDLEMVNGVDWLVRNKGLKAGEKLGDIYLEGEYGENALAGARAAAAANKLTVVEQRIHSTDKDLSAQVAALKAAGVHFTVMTSTPSQVAAVATQAAAQHYDLTIMGSNPTYDPSILTGPAGPALAQRYYVAQSYAPYSGDGVGPSLVRSEYAAAYPNQPVSASSPGYGYGQAQIMFRILDAACRSGSLERPALLKAFRTLSAVDTEGLIAPLDYSKPGQPPARQVFIAQPDPESAGGLKVIQTLFASPTAQTFQP